MHSLAERGNEKKTIIITRCSYTYLYVEKKIRMLDICLFKFLLAFVVSRRGCDAIGTIDNFVI
jgi:hypothetical protein